MSSFGYDSTVFRLSSDKLETILSDIRESLRGRVDEAYVFGSASTGEYSPESDIDLILITEELGDYRGAFPLRPLLFKDLYDIYPKLDILVYTPLEFSEQISDSETGFWKSVRTSMKQLMPKEMVKKR